MEVRVAAPTRAVPTAQHYFVWAVIGFEASDVPSTYAITQTVPLPAREAVSKVPGARCFPAGERDENLERLAWPRRLTAGRTYRSLGQVVSSPPATSFR